MNFRRGPNVTWLSRVTDASIMADTPEDPRMLGERAARQLSNTTKTPPYWVGTTPRWLVQLLPWTPVEAGVNRVVNAGFAVECSPDDASPVPVALIDYAEKPREYTLSSVTTTIEVHTRI